MPDIPVSKKYLHDVKVLHTEHAEHRITDEEFSQRLDELIKREVKAHASLGPVLVRQELENTEKDIELAVKKELQQKEQEREAEERTRQLERIRQRRRQEQEQEAQKYRESQERRRREIERNNYRRAIDVYVNRLEAKARQWQSWYGVLQIILIVFSAGTATMAGLEGVPRGWVSATGFVAAVLGTILTTFKIQETIYASRKAVAEVQLEAQKYDYHIDEYKELDTEAAFIRFSRNITAIQGQEMLQEVEFWNPKKEEKKEAEPAQTHPKEEKEDKETRQLPEKSVQEETEAEQAENEV